METPDIMTLSDRMRETAIAAKTAVRMATPGDRPRLVADLAACLAQLGHAKAVTVDVAGTPEAFEAVRSFLAQWRRDFPQPEEGASVSPVSVQQACAGHPNEGQGVSAEGHPSATRICGQCGASFRVNYRHVTVHRFCSAACRSKHRHRLKRTGVTSNHSSSAHLAASSSATLGSI
jgi:hypothetical protein